MFSDDELNEKDAEVQALFGDVSARPSEPSQDDEERIERILGRVRLESLMKDTASFVFQSFGVTLSGVTRALFDVLPKSRPSEDKDSQDQPPSS